ncbi:MAG: PUA domain-containing protein [Candidatus Thorarchaeota archaeon]
MKPEFIDPVLWESVMKQMDSDFGEGITNKILGNLAPAVIEHGDTKSMYLVPNDWMSMVDEDFNDFEVRYLGIWLGDMIKDRLRLSLPILEKLSTLTENIIVVNKKSAEAFTYGRSILKEGVASLSATLERGKRVIVKDQQGHVLGLAVLSVDGRLLEKLGKEKLVAKNLVDIGWYLRRLG